MTLNCIRPKEAREWLQNYIFETRKQNIVLDRFWFHRFRSRHSDVLKIMKVHSRESERCSVTAADVNLYFNQLTDALTQVTCFSLIINMDESGFISRPQKDKCQNCCYLKDCPVTSTFREERNSSHISIVGAVSIDGKVLKPMLLSINQNPSPEIRETWLEGTFEWFKTPKGYMNHDSMIAWMRNILFPYINEQREKLGNGDLPALLIMDGLKAHLMNDIAIELAQNNAFTVCLPAQLISPFASS